MSDSQAIYREQSAQWQALHTWINRRQEERHAAGEPRESTLYEWKNMESERRRLPILLRQAFEGTLPTIHQQCSRQAPEPITENRLVCALGQEVTSCSILLSLQASFAEQREHQQRMAERLPHYTPGLTDGSVYRAMSTVCCWHIYTSVFDISPDCPEGRRIDTSEGFMQDESDRMFWRRTYQNLAAGLEDDEDINDG